MVRELKRKRKSNVDTVKRLMIINGQNYEDWLDDLHADYIDENQDVILMALESQAENLGASTDKGK